MGKIPKSWITAKVHNIGQCITGNTPPTKVKENYGDYIPFVKPPELKNYPIISAASYLSQTGIEKARILPKNSVLVSCIGNLGRTAINKVSVAFNQQINAINTSKYVDPHFIFYQVQSQYFREQLEQYSSATTISIINKSNFELLNLQIAPLNEQKRIVAKIEQLFSELDKGVEALKTARAQLKVYRQSLLKHAFEGKLTADWREKNNAPEWEGTTLGDQLSFLTSGSRGWAKFYSDSGDTFIRAQNIKHDCLNLEDIAYVSLPSKSEGMRTRVQVGDLLITITGANVTKTAFFSKDIGAAYVSQHVALARPNEDIHTEYLYLYLIAETEGRKQLLKFAYGAGKPGLNLTNIRDVTLKLPCIDEQIQIASVINENLSVLDNMETDISDQLKKSEALRQSILKKAFSGKLVPQDPSDERAAKLLERIKAEKAALATPAKRTKRKKAS